MILAPAPRKVVPADGRCPAASLTPTVQIDPAAVPASQGYRLELQPSAITITAHDEAGAFYAKQTLAQVVAQCDVGGNTPCARIDDHPDCSVRGMMIDISRDRVPTMETLLAIIDRLASLKINQVQLYTEHTFAYAGHETVWGNASPMTPDEVRRVDDYCAERFIELVPNQNCFGHLERWLVHEPYRDLAECPEGFWRDDLPKKFFYPRPTTLNPLDPRCLELVDDMLGQLLPCFRSDTVNVGCDETFDLGKGRSKEACERRGKGRVYLEFLKKLHGLCEKHGKRMQYWADIALHYPELLDELPGDAVALNWGYEADHPFEKETGALSEAGVPYFVCPSNASFVGISGRYDVAIANTQLAAKHGLANGAAGYLNTWWGDFGHWQPLAVNDPGIVSGAASSWCLEANEDLDVPAALDRFIYRDDAARLGSAVAELGRMRDDLPCNRDNLLGWSLIRDEAELVDGYLELPWGPTGPVSMDALGAARHRVERATAGVALADVQRADGPLLLDELRVAGRMLTHAIDNLAGRLEHGVAHSRGLPQTLRKTLDADLADIITSFEHNWNQRSRPGGLHDSMAALRRLRGYYQHPQGDLAS